MKTINKYVLSATIIAFLTMNMETFAQVGIAETVDPPVEVIIDPSAMLDIQSNAKGVLIPRMTAIQRDAIASPADGLLVFVTDKKSFWFYNATIPIWKEVTSGSSLIDNDGDTRVEVEKVTDTDPNGDEINFTTRGTERMKIGNDGEILMGTNVSSQPTTFFEIGSDGIIKLGNKGASATTANGFVESDALNLENYTKITADGSLSYVGNATRWDDLKVPVNSVKIKEEDILDVEYDVFMDQIAVLYFNDDVDKDKEESVMFTVQMPHAWKEGTAIYPHVHWVSETNVGSDKVEWVLEYSWASLGQVFPSSQFLSSTTVADGATGDGEASAYEHVITPLGNITATGKTLSSMLVCRLYRDVTNGSEDSFDTRVALLEIDFHYQIDSDGSNQEYKKE